MKKKNKFLLVLTCSLLLCVCGGCSSSKSNKKTQKVASSYIYDNKMIAADLKKGLETRWDISDSLPEDENQSYEDYAADRQKCIEAEINILKKYKPQKNISFKDSEAKNLIQSYIDILETQDVLFGDSFTNSPTLNSYNYDVYNGRRAKTLKQMVSKFNIKFSKKYQTSYNDVVKNNGYAPKKDIVIDNPIEIKQITLKPSSYGYREYKVKIENMTNNDYDLVSIDIRCYDKDNTVVDDRSISYYNLKAYQSMWESDSVDLKDKISKIEIVSYGFSAKTGALQYQCYESETPFSDPVIKNL